VHALAAIEPAKELGPDQKAEERKADQEPALEEKSEGLHTRTAKDWLRGKNLVSGCVKSPERAKAALRRKFAEPRAARGFNLHDIRGARGRFLPRERAAVRRLAFPGGFGNIVCMIVTLTTFTDFWWRST
jgi:hypothetical protein